MYVRDSHEEQSLIEGVVFCLCIVGALSFAYRYPYLALQTVLWGMAIFSGALSLAALFHGLRGRR